MTLSSSWSRAAALLAALIVAACTPAPESPGTAPAPRPPPPVEPSPAASAATAAAVNEADLAFVHGMIAHHAQALEMTALVPERTQRPDLRLLAERIDVSQRDEIVTLQRWLRDQGWSAESALAHGGHEGHAMAGMLTAEEMARLAQARGPAFERLFLELMIRHHEGALRMVEALFATPGGGQSSQIYQIASDVEADQRAEIARMRRMLEAPPSGASHR